jgi:hypothetical protein
MKRAAYQPTITTLSDGTVEQSFSANVVHVSDEVIALGDIIPDKKKGLPYGTPVHSLLLHLSERGAVELIELNDQDNTVPRKAVRELTVARGTLRIVFQKGKGPLAGGVAAPDTGPALGALKVAFEADAATTKKLQAKLKA